LQAWRASGVRLAAGSDAPFGGLSPWAAMAAAVDRPPGFGTGEVLTPEAALALYLGPADNPGGPARQVAVDATADLCLIADGWGTARNHLAAVRVRATFVAGEMVFCKYGKA
jgi:predicted amidohydrolase YtcJ